MHTLLASPPTFFGSNFPHPGDEEMILVMTVDAQLMETSSILTEDPLVLPGSLHTPGS
jgi:hypothetical protein